MKKLIYLVVIVVILGLIVSGCLPVVPPTEQSNIGNLTKGTTINVPADHGTIQAAIDAANPGDTIIVGPGTYVEYTGAPGAGCAVTIPWFADGAGGLTIQSSDGPGSTIIDCGAAAWGVQMVSNQITFTGFTVKNAYSVINQVSGTGHTLSNLVITDFVNYGLGVYAGNNCTFSNITIHTNDVSKSENRTVKGIDIQGYGSGGNTNNTFEDITIYDIETTGYYGTSMGIWWSTSSTFPDWDNTFTNLTIHDITAPEWGAYGVYIMGQLSGTVPYAIENTTFSGGSIDNIGGGTLYVRGIYVAYGRCKDLNISGFDISGCREGILIRNRGNEACVNVDIHYNNIAGNTEYGVQDYDGDNDVDATYNWWGHPGGPRRPAGNSGQISGPKAADQVSENVLYHPWLNGANSVSNIALNQAATASATYLSYSATRAVDGDYNTSWIAEGYPPQWIEIDLGKGSSVVGLRLLPDQTRAGLTTHVVMFSDDGGVVGDYTLTGVTEAKQWVEAWFDAPFRGVRTVRVTTEVVTLPHLSWVAWFEIEVYGWQ